MTPRAERAQKMTKNWKLEIQKTGKKMKIGIKLRVFSDRFFKRGHGGGGGGASAADWEGATVGWEQYN